MQCAIGARSSLPLSCHGCRFTRNHCACAPMLYISELCEDCIPSRMKLTLREPASMTTDKESRRVTSYSNRYEPNTRSGTDRKFLCSSDWLMRSELGWFARSLISGLNDDALTLRTSDYPMKWTLRSWMVSRQSIESQYIFLPNGEQKYHMNGMILMLS